MKAVNHYRLNSKDILPMDEYKKIRKEKRKEIINIKRYRRLDIGPYISMYFENRATMWYQIQEMLFIEKGGIEQVKDELEAYNSLIPNGKELIATLMVEIDKPAMREKILSTLGGIEEEVYFNINEVEVRGVAEADLDRTNANGKASSVQFIHFSFDDKLIKLFSDSDVEISISIKHKCYGHSAIIDKMTCLALASDFSLK